MKFTATFTPQAWQNDYAIEVDPEGPTTWDVTPEVEAILAKGKPVPDPDTYESDDLRYAAAAPQWTADWTGPFYITVTEDDK